MTTNELADVMLSWGYDIKPLQYQKFLNYLDEMLKRERVLIIWKNGIIACIVVFFLTDNFENAYKKGQWEIPNDNPKGHQIYVEKMVCYRWSHGLRRALQNAIEDTFPNVVEGYYHRAPYDRCIKIYRRKHVQSPVS